MLKKNRNVLSPAILLLCIGVLSTILPLSRFYIPGSAIAQEICLDSCLEASGESAYISPVSATPLIISWPLTKAYPGIEYNIRLAVVGGKYPYTFELTQAPQGMSIDADRGEITWTPPLNEEFNTHFISIIVTDQLGEQDFQSFHLEVTKNGFYFVSGQGDDAFGTGSFESPWRTIDFAVRQGTTDGILYVREGTYAGQVDMEPGYINKWIAFPGDPQPVIDLQRKGIHPDDDYMYVDGFEIHNGGRSFFWMKNTSYSVFRRNHMHHGYDNSTGENPCFIWFPDRGTHERPIIQDNIFHDLYDRGIEGDPAANFHAAASVFYNNSYALMEDNEIYNIDGRGLYDKDDGYRNTFRNNYVHDVYGDASAIGNQYGVEGNELLFNLLEARDVSYAGKFFAGHKDQIYDHIRVHHNTFIGQIFVDGIAQNDMRFTDNVVDTGNRQVNWCCSQETSPPYASPEKYTFDHNIYWSTDPYFSGMHASTRKTFEEWQLLGHDPASFYAELEFTDALHGDYKPVSGSAACGAAHDGSDIGAVSCQAESVPQGVGNDFKAPIQYASIPSGTLPSAGWTYVVFNTDEPAICHYENIAGVNFDAMTGQFSSRPATLHALRLWNLPDGEHNYYIQCQDEFGNTNIEDFIISFSKGGPLTPDTVPPSVPTDLTLSAISSSQINISFSASTDDVAVAGYNIYRDGAFIATTASTSYSDTGLIAETTYDYSVSAVDTSNNESMQSVSLAATTLEDPVLTPPKIEIIAPDYGATFATPQVDIAYHITGSLTGVDHLVVHLNDYDPITYGLDQGKITFDSLEDATYSLTMHMKDASNNQIGELVGIVFNVDAVADDTSFCGDGNVDPDEECDGAAPDDRHRCLDDCTLEYIPYCGDGIVNNDEECDGSAPAHYKCLSNCVLEYIPYCGDGIINNTEQCDGQTGVGEHQDCSETCQLVDLPYCGDAVVNQDTEECDGSAPEHYNCLVDCTLEYVPYCGDGIVDPNEKCDDGPDNGDVNKCNTTCLGQTSNISQSFFHDGFESADMSATNDEGFMWAKNNRTSVVTMNNGVPTAVYNNGPIFTQVSGRDWTAKEGSYSLRFRYPAGINSMAEQRFDLGAPQREMWFSFWMRVPDNFKHGDHSPTNNKLFALWMDGYENQGDGSTVWWNFWNDGSNGSKHSLAITSGRYTPGQGHQQYTPFISYPDDQGRWMHMVMHVKAESSEDASDGLVETWRKWENETEYTKIVDLSDAPLRVPANGPDGWKTGYVLGWSNPGYDQDTEFLFDDFKMSTTNLLNEEPDWQLKPEYHNPAYIEPTLVYPRPDAETNSWARHRWAHPGVEYRIPAAVVQGGAWPFYYELLDGPAGATVGNFLKPKGDVLEAGPDYGVLRWTPPPSDEGKTFNFHVRVTDQDGNVIDAQWTATVDSSRFLFVALDGEDSNPGTINQPLQTFSGWYKNDANDSTHANKLVYFREGQYVQKGDPDKNNNLRIDTGKKPMSYMAYPGEHVVFDATKAVWTYWTGGDDVFYSGIRFEGSKLEQPDGTPLRNARNIAFYGGKNQSRITFFENTVYDIEPGNPLDPKFGNDNPAFVWRPMTPFPNRGKYWAFVNNTFDTAGPLRSNGPSAVSLSCASYVVYEGNKAVNWSGTAVFFDKSNNEYLTSRNNDFWLAEGDNGGLAKALVTGMSNSYQPEHAPGYAEFAWNRVKISDIHGRETISIGRGTHDGDAYGSVFVYRNSVFGGGTTYAADTRYPFLAANNFVQGEIRAFPTGSESELAQGSNYHEADKSEVIFDINTGALTGTYRDNYLGTYGAEIPYVTTPGVNTGEINNPPVLSPIPDMVVNEGDMIKIDPSAIDPDGDPLTISYTGFMTADSYQTTFEDAGIHTVTVRASDGTLTDSAAVRITINDVNRAPVINPVKDQHVGEGQTLSFTLTASDADGDPVIYNTSPDGLPVNAEFADLGSGQAEFFWTTQFGDAGEHEIICEAQDDQGGIGQQTVQIIVDDTNFYPLLDPINDQSVNEGQALSFLITASDLDGDTLAFSVNPMPEGASLEPGNALIQKNSAEFHWLPDFNQSGTHVLTFKVTDPSMTEAEQSVRITVNNVDIAPSVPENLKKSSATASQAFIKWDPSKDDDSVAGYSVYRDQALIAEVSTTSYSDSGLTSGTAYTYMVSAFDNNGNFSAKSDPLEIYTDPICGNERSEKGEVCDGSAIECLTEEGYAGHRDCLEICSGYGSCIADEYCGDGRINGRNEECDGTAGVGDLQKCSDTCQIVNLPYCGDGIVNNGEQCDGSAGVGENQACNDKCALIELPYCGNDKVDGDEECDGSAPEHYRCLDNCILEYIPYCGDGVVNNSEECDGTAGVGDLQKCSDTCQIVNLPYCGDGIVNNGEQCDGTAGVGENQACNDKCALIELPYCGNDKVDGDEECDGSAPEHYRCLDNCILEYIPYCGDGLINTPGEQCDGTSGIQNGQKCTPKCRIVRRKSRRFRFFRWLMRSK